LLAPQVSLRLVLLLDGLIRGTAAPASAATPSPALAQAAARACAQRSLAVDSFTGGAAGYSVNVCQSLVRIRC